MVRKLVLALLGTLLFVACTPAGSGGQTADEEKDERAVTVFRSPT